MNAEDELAQLKKKVAKKKKQNRLFLFGMLCMIFGVLLGALLVVAPVRAAHDYYEVKPTIDSDPTHQADYKMQQQYGYIKVMLRCGYNTLSPNFVLTNLDANVSKEYSINPDGFFKEEFKVGNYSALLPDGNGGQPEPIQYFQVVAQETSYVSFLGHAISTDGSIKDVIVIKEATYGAVERRCHQELVREAWTETIPAWIEHVFHKATYTPCNINEHNHVHAKEVGSNSPHDFEYNGHKYQIVGDSRQPTFKLVTNSYWENVLHPAQTIQHPAEYRTVCENYGSFVDVTKQVQDAVDNGFREMMFFDNAQNPGGLFVSTGLFRPIQDPAIGIVKDVIIEYSINGVNKEIVTKEYEKIRI